MTLEGLNEYVKDLRAKGLTKIDASVEVDPDDEDNIFVVKTKETYTLESEADADQLIEEAGQSATCVGHDKKFKQGKVNKQGEVTRPDCYIVVIKHNL